MSNKFFVTQHESDYDKLERELAKVTADLVAARWDAGHLWHALKDLSFDCDGVTQTVAPKLGTYNSTFAVCQRLSEKYQSAEHYQIRVTNKPAIKPTEFATAQESRDMEVAESSERAAQPAPSAGTIKEG